MRPLPPACTLFALLLSACHARPVALEPDPSARFDAAAAEAARLVPDPARGGPPLDALASPLPPFGGVDRATATYIGVAECASCHRTQGLQWLATPHATALNGLAAAGATHRPDCVRCHVTGASASGESERGASEPGAREAGGRLAGVQCEACHGPGSAHAATMRSSSAQAPGNRDDRRSGVPPQPVPPDGRGASRPADDRPGRTPRYGARTPYGTLPRSQAACVACHTWETAPDFAYDAAWARIAH